MSVKWTTCNVGAEEPSDYGDYFAWGEIEPKSVYMSKNSVTYRRKMSSIACDPNYDAIRASWGDTWHLPTIEEIDELINNCTWEWTTQEGQMDIR